MTIQKIVSIAEHVESLGATIQSSNAFDSLTTEQVTAETSVETPAQELLQKYSAPHCAKLVLEAAEIYEKRGILL